MKTMADESTKCCACSSRDGVKTFGNDNEPFCADCQADMLICHDCGWVGEDCDLIGWEQKFCPECRSIECGALECWAGAQERGE